MNVWTPTSPTRLVRYVVEVALRIRFPEVESRGQEACAKRCNGRHELECASGT